MHQTSYTFDMNGVFRNNKKVHYVSKSQRYIYVPYSILQDIYKQSECTPRYIGYIIKTDTYDELNKLVDYYESKGYRINDSFTDREAMNSLDSYYKNMMFILNQLQIFYVCFRYVRYAPNEAYKKTVGTAY